MKFSKINIFFPFKNEISGGGANFLKLLKNDIEKSNFNYSNFIDSEILLININPLNLTLKRVLFLIKNIKLLANKIILFRVDGKIFDYRHKGYLYDWYIERFLLNMSDFIIFQSNWSKNRYRYTKENFRVIKNYVNENFFHNSNKSKNKTKKIRLLFTSFSGNFDKGYGILDFLDKNLDFKRFEIICLSPLKNLKFQNIIQKGLKTQEEIGYEFNKSDLYLFLSLNESCSNALLEAININIPILAVNSGSNLELIGSEKYVFNSNHELLQKLNNFFNSSESYDSSYFRYPISNSKNEYLYFFENLKPPELTFFRNIKIFLILFFFLFFIPLKRL